MDSTSPRTPIDLDISVDWIWSHLQQTASELIAAEPMLTGVMRTRLLDHSSYHSALRFMIAAGLTCHEVDRPTLLQIVEVALDADERICEDSVADLVAFYTRDPACNSLLEPFLYYKGFRALQAYRVSHSLWRKDRRDMARMFQSLISDRYAMDLHPGARIAGGIFIDHGTGIVVGETSVIEENVSILHNVTLGGTGKAVGDRHPKIRRGVLIGAGAKILGNIVVGEGSKVAAGSVVLTDVPPHTTVAGVPAKVRGKPKTEAPSLDMDQELG